MISAPFGAEHRLLSPLIPACFFGLALGMHGLFWLGTALLAPHLVGHAGGFGPVLGVLHLLTIGVLLMTAVGATLQILPVATLHSAPSKGLGLGVFALLALAAAGVPGGFLAVSPLLLALGTGAAGLGMILYAAMVLKIVGAAGRTALPGARGFLLLAVLSLAGFLLLAALLAGAYLGVPVPLFAHNDLALAHALLALFGFMGCLVLGFSHVLIPMLALAHPPAAAKARPSLILTLLALLLAVGGTLSAQPLAVMLSGGMALAAAGLHVRSLWATVDKRLRRRLPWGFWLVRASWLFLPLCLVLGLLAAAGIAPERTGPAFIALALSGWLLSLLMGVLQQILPFLGSMHTMRLTRTPALVPDLTWTAPLTLHTVAHLLAVLLLTCGLLLASAPLIALAGAAGVVGAVAFIAFALTVWRRTVHHCHAHPLLT